MLHRPVRVRLLGLAGQAAAVLTPAEWAAKVRATNGNFDTTQHISANHVVDFDGADAATCVSYMQAQHWFSAARLTELGHAADEPRWCTLGGFYTNSRRPHRRGVAHPALPARRDLGDRRSDRVRPGPLDGRPRLTMELIANFMSGDLDPVAWARRREEEGWHALGCADHFYSPNRGYPHLWVTLATFAAATSRVMLTSSFANNLFRTPVEFAEASLQLQKVSGGRFEAGLGAGWDRAETEAAGLVYPGAGERAGRYAEAVQIVRQLFATGSCSFHGRYYDIEVPKLGPSDRDPPPLVASLGGDRTIREIAPLVDRVELKLNAPATRDGSLDFVKLAEIPRSTSPTWWPRSGP